MKAVDNRFKNEGAVIRKVETVVPKWRELKKNGIWQGFLFFVLILIYVGLRFEYNLRQARFLFISRCDYHLGRLSLFDGK